MEVIVCGSGIVLNEEMCVVHGVTIVVSAKEVCFMFPCVGCVEVASLVVEVHLFGFGDSIGV